ncbi:putative quinol monooxygenase [Henriciella aquimarina]|uniref:putative quinol monooxygenase n=1 Tax=Henriciella aquimarina TaxID=545261 RepID=UPI000A03801C|nr:putative quinol monooxygenase [Henriciella aquimarina]
MIGVVAKLKVAEGKNAEFEEIGKDLMAKVKANEAGTLTYQLYQSKADPQTYIFMEQYANEDALKAHGATDYFKEAGAKLGGCLAGRPDIEYYDIVE